MKSDEQRQPVYVSRQSVVGHGSCAAIPASQSYLPVAVVRCPGTWNQLGQHGEYAPGWRASQLKQNVVRTALAVEL
eukprot:scaffold672_cov474-Pavlova_lutheri.AAC.1